MVMIDGTVIHTIVLNDYWNFKDVKVFAGSGNGVAAADASYKNLVWENLPVPDILFHMDTPAIVSFKTILCTI